MTSTMGSDIFIRELSQKTSFKSRLWNLTLRRLSGSITRFTKEGGKREPRELHRGKRETARGRAALPPTIPCPPCPLFLFRVSSSRFESPIRSTPRNSRSAGRRLSCTARHWTRLAHAAPPNRGRASGRTGRSPLDTRAARGPPVGLRPHQAPPTTAPGPSRLRAAPRGEPNRDLNPRVAAGLAMLASCHTLVRFMYLQAWYRIPYTLECVRCFAAWDHFSAAPFRQPPSADLWLPGLRGLRTPRDTRSRPLARGLRRWGPSSFRNSTSGNIPRVA